MRRSTPILLSAVIGLLPAWPVLAGESVESASAALPAKGEEASFNIEATITAIDKEQQLVTLTGPQGRSLKLQVRDPAKLAMAKVGDKVAVSYTVAVGIAVKKAGTADVGRKEQTVQVGSDPGDNPGAAMGTKITVTGTITQVDREAGSATIRNPEGEEETFKLKDPSVLAQVKAGDLVQATYHRALMLELVPSKPTEKL